MRGSFGLAVALLAAPTMAQDAPVAVQGPSAQGDVAVTIYNNDLALVQDVRQLSLPAGVSRQEFPDVSAQIRAETVSLAAAGTDIVEQNFDYDLLSPQALMQKAVGQTITIVRTNPANGAETREQAKVLAVNNGVVLQIGGRIEVLRDDGLPVRVIFDRVPPNLRARPTLSVTLDSERGGSRPVTLSYLTPGLGWKADYVALFDEAKRQIDVQGWITLTNQTGTTFTNADTVLVAGEVAQVDGGQQRYNGGYQPPRPPRGPGNIRNPGTESADREQIGDFYLYPLKARTTIANAQQKQVSFLDVTGAAAARAYEFRNGWLGTAEEARSADTVLKFSNAKSGGLGDALPAGIVRVYQRDMRGQPQFVGENSIGHTPMGSELGLKTGEAFDVKVRPIVEKRERITYDQWQTTSRFRITTPDGPVMGEADSLRRETFWRTTMRYTLTNARSQAVTVDLVQAGLDNYWDDTRLISESLKSTRKSVDEVEWTVPVPANGTVVVTAVFETRY